MNQFSEPGASGSSAAGGGLADQAQEKAGEVAGQAQEKAQQAAGQIQERVREQIGQRTAAAAEQIGGQADDLRAASSTLREQGKEGPAQAADRLAGYAERASRYLQQRDADALLADVEDFGRRQPWALAAAGLAAGFAASRFLKASSRDRYQARVSGSGGARGLTVPRPAGVYAGGPSNGLGEASPYSQGPRLSQGLAHDEGSRIGGSAPAAEAPTRTAV